MTREELLEEAKRKYPIGTRYISPYSGDKKIVKCHEDEFDWSSSTNGIHDGGSFVYYDNKWAEILEYPKDYIKNTYCEIY